MDGNGVQPFILDSPDGSLMECIPEHHESQCCCGNVACAFLRDTQEAFDKLDESLRTAGRLGQALLVRHEAYVADAEAERKQMRAEVDKLGSDKQYLQIQNSVIIEENRTLLEQLEAANTAVSESDTHVTSLTATLHSAQVELHKLNSLARRTEALERELEQFEQEQARLHASLAVKTEEERSATQRWHSAERTLTALEDRVEAIEREAREERERHVEIVGRMERRRAVEKELDTAASRLKGAAAAKTGIDKGGTGVVSHFVKDILQDNANLQMSMLEMRDLLMQSHEEIERLREQMLQHSPLSEDVDVTPKKPSRNLNDEMSRRASEVHVHHHYHAPPTKPEPNRRHSQTLRKPKKKRAGISFGNFTPPSGFQTPRHDSVSSFGFPTPLSTANTLVVSTPSDASHSIVSHRWSVQSSLPMSSVPSSPQSYSSPSVFDHPFSDAGTNFDSSRPTTPGTEVESPFFGATAHSKRASGASFFRPIDDVLQEYDSDEGTSPSSGPNNQESEIEDTDVELERSGEAAAEEDIDPEHSLVNFSEPVPRPWSPCKRSERPMSFTEDDLPADFGHNLKMPPLRRSASHESLLSVSGMDIHTLKSRPSQMLTGQTPRTISTQPMISATVAHAARPALAPRSSSNLLAGVASTSVTTESSQGFGKRVSGWMFGRWGAAPAPTSAGTSLSNLNPARYQAEGITVSSLTGRQEITTLAGNRISISSLDDDDDDADYLEGTGFAELGRGGAAAELERVLEGLDEDDPRRKSIEREVAKVLDENMKGFSLAGGPFA